MKKLYIFLLFLIMGATLQAQQFSNNDISKILQSNTVNKDLQRADIDQVFISHQNAHKTKPFHYVYLHQAHDDLPILNTSMTLVVENDGKVLHQKSNFLTGINSINKKTSPSKPIIDIIPAIAKILGDRYDNDAQFLQLKKGFHTYESPSLSTDPIQIRPVYYHKKKTLIKSYEVQIFSTQQSKWWQIIIDAADASLVALIPWTVECNFHKNEKACHHDHKHSYTKKEKRTLNNNQSATGEAYEVFASTLTDPNDGARTLEVDPWNDATNASPFGWHDTDGISGAEYTITRGNNVYAQEDTDADNGVGYSPDGTAALQFSFPCDLNLAPSGYQDAAITNLFYWNNIMHDVWYQYGFDEQSGNFQNNLYGNAGGSNDEVIAEAQDGSGTNNANFSTPSDGNKPRMQMYIWNVSLPIDLNVNAPVITAGTYNASGASFGPQFGTFSGTLVEALPNDGCTAITNTAAINGNIALIDRGTCPFTTKIANAETAGATAVIICNNDTTAPFTMGGTDPGLTIPAIMISQADCNTIRVDLPADVDFTLNGPSQRDSDLDNSVIIHEYGHGISTRLTGGPANSSCLSNGEQMGEGWSDWFANVMTIKASDVASQGAIPHGMGAYLSGEPSTSNGIRTYPYTTDMSINPHTYDDIKTAAAPHGIGSIWCAMLWDMTWRLIDQYGFDADIYNGTGGNNIAMQLVIEGLKLQPCSPGFIDGRDAIIAADQLLHNGANVCLIWEAFADRGLGYSATQGSSGSASDGAEAFDVSPLCQPILFIEKTADDIVTTVDDICYEIFVNNNKGTDVTNAEISDIIPTGLDFVAGSNNIGTYTPTTLSFVDPLMATGTNHRLTFKARSDLSDSSEIVFYDDFEINPADWTATTGQGTDAFQLTNTNTYRGANAYFIANVNADNTHYLTSQSITLPADPLLSFYHDYDTEAGWDGGVVQLSNDGGATWDDLSDNFVMNGYPGGLGSSSNADIANLPGFSGSSGGYIKSIADIKEYAGQTVTIRFLFGSDNNTFSTGWYLDDIMVYKGYSVRNIACIKTDEGDELCDTTHTLVMPRCDTYNRYYLDRDNDGFGDAAVEGYGCIAPVGYVVDNTDCTDANPMIHPNHPEICDGLDNDCNGLVDDNCANLICGNDTIFVNMVTQNFYHAKHILESDATTMNGTNILMTAGDTITLWPGFEVQLGAEYEARIEGCN